MNKEEVINKLKNNKISFNDYVCHKFKNDEEVVSVAIDLGWSISSISDNLKDNENIMLKAIKIDKYALSFVSERLLSDEFFVKKAILINPISYMYIKNSFKENEDIFLLSLAHKESHSIAYTSEKIKNNKNIAIKVIQNNPSDFDYLPSELKKDKEICLEAFKKDKFIYLKFPEEIKKVCNRINAEEVLTKLIYEEKNNFILNKIEIKENTNKIINKI